MVGVLRSAVTWLTVVFLGIGVGLEVGAPPCFGIQQCLQHGVDNTISTIIMGFLTCLWMLGLALHLWTIKCRSSTAKRKRNDHRTNIRPSAIWAQGYMGLAVLLPALARVLEPNATLGSRQFWSLNAMAALLVALSTYCVGHFAMRSIQMYLRVLCCGCCTAVGFTTGLVIQSALVVFGAAVACAVFSSSMTTATIMDSQGNSSLIESNVTLDDDEIITMSLRSDVNIFDHNGTRILLELMDTAITHSQDFSMEGLCQHLFFWGHVALASASFMFWYASSINIRQAIRRREQKLNTMEGEHLAAWGMQSMTAAHLLPWVSFTIGSFFPVWVVIIAKAKDMDWLDVWLSLRGGIVYHYGLALMALCLHNCSMTLTYRDNESPPPPTFKFNEAVFHDLTLGVFERNRQDRVERNAVFHDLTFGIFEPFETTTKPPIERHDVYDEELDMQSETSDDESSVDDCGSETTISRLDHQSFGQTRIFQPNGSGR